MLKQRVLTHKPQGPDKKDEHVDESDPMNKMRSVEEVDMEPKKASRSKRERTRPIEVTMPARACEKGSPDKVVSVLNASTNALYVRESDIPWLMQYLADEVALGGVEREDEESAVAEAGNCR